VHLQFQKNFSGLYPGPHDKGEGRERRARERRGRKGGVGRGGEGRGGRDGMG
jgi:hypothetical protein